MTLISRRMSMTGNPSDLHIVMALSAPTAMHVVAIASAVIQHGATTVADMTSVETGRQVSGEMV